MTRFRLIALVATLLTPAVALAAPRTFQEFANILVTLMSNTSIVLVVLGLVVYFWGVSTNVIGLQGGKEAAGEKIRAYFFWGIIIFFVMVSVWGILQLLQNTVFGSDANSPAGLRGTPNDQPQFNRRPFVQ